MAIDGSFRLEAELRRFISRCPKLAKVPVFSYLLNKGDKVTEEEVVGAVGEVFLHPNYTIPLIGCFRPIAKKIVNRAVSLLRLVPDLRSNSDDSIVEFDEDKFLREDEDTDTAQVVSLIDMYVRSGKCLNLHEVACLALCRALDLIPLLLGSVLGYFEFTPPPFEKIKLTRSVAEVLSTAGNRLLIVVQISYRFLLAESEVFTTLWDWSFLIDLMEQLANLVLSEDAKDAKLAKLLMDVNDLRWCGIQILLRVLKLSDGAFEKFGFDSEEAFKCLSRWQVFCQDISLEKASWYLEPSVAENLDLIAGCSNCCQERDLQSCTFGSFHDLFSNSNDVHASGHTGRPFVLTSAVKRSYEMVFLALSQRWPVLLHGPAGAGKTALIRNLAQNHGSQVLFIHMDEQIDGKTLLGSYVCTEKPGEFRWQPGSLTQAVCDGLWIVFEDIDKAPSDIQSILLPLLEGATLFSTGYGEAIRVSEGFRLFSTVTSSKLDTPHAIEGRNSFGALWRRIVIGSSSKKDMLTILHAWYPEVDVLAEELIETFDIVNKLTGHQFGTSTASSSFNSRFSQRDLLKWCKRIVGLGYCFERDALTAYMLDSIYKEAVDVFAAFSTKVENRLALMKEIANIWKVSAPKTLYPVNKPVIKELRADLHIGRITLHRSQLASSHEKKPFVEIHSSVHILERIACSVKHNEPVLLVGETGTGKTTLVQNLAMRLGQKLTVLNLSQQSDAADLLGGFKPINAQFVCIPLYREFENLFNSTFSSKDNEKFLIHLRKSVAGKNWKQLIDHCQKVLQKVADVRRYGSGTKRKRSLGPELWEAWDKFSIKLERVRAQIGGSSGMVFSFVEGAFVTALKNGEWILLDEVNLAPPETLQRIIGVLEEENGSFCLPERGDVDYIRRDPNFRIFACMNPATDAGKRDLPSSLRGRFTEYFVDDVLNDEDLMMFIHQFMDDDHSNRELVNKVMHFYKAAKKEAEERLQDGANMKPQYSLRSLYRALEYTKKARRKFGFDKALYDGFCMFFLSLLDVPSAKLMNQLISSYLLGDKIPQEIPFDSYLIISDKSAASDLLENYVLTKSVKEHLRNLARAIFASRYPVLLQGPTSSGKTSLVQYLAAITGHEFVRINNHEHTDLQEYLGSYITDSSGKLVFLEGALVRAVRNGHWIVLDELNLAPSDVLEALNRLLDDNRELFIPELNETVRAHPEFMLFATQNPPTLYGGRKILSRAFRNRFVEIQVEEIPYDELSTILEKRCKIPQTYAKKMVDVMKELQLHRQSSKIFAGKHGFITPRDLFRWANRFSKYGISYEDLARDGYSLMAERLRDDDEKRVVQEVLERQLRVKLPMAEIYKQEAVDDVTVGKYSDISQDLGRIIWTRSMWRLYFLVERCYSLREPVLLVGETGGGKTTVCQMLSCYLGLKLHILNCHQYTETSDFLGGFYPLRDRSYISSDFEELCQKLMNSKALIHFPGDATISSDVTQASLTIAKLAVVIDSYRQGRVSHPDVSEEEIKYIEQLSLDLDQLHQRWQTIFVWQDGPLVEAMKKGDLILVDEISLADDSVLERLNSVLEPERKLSLAEKGGSDLEKITAHPNFFILATMNPGGDYGKKELSPALRNRFTEIWVPSVVDVNELKSIAVERISNLQLESIVDVLLEFWEWFNNLQTGRMLTVRDLLSWVSFMNVAEKTLQPESAFLHGAFLVLLDGLTLGTTLSRRDTAEIREKCLSFLLERLKEKRSFDYVDLSSLECFGWADPQRSAVITYPESLRSDNLFGIHPFYIEKGPCLSDAKGFEFLAPTTRRNALRVLRAMQLAKPVLLEGSPGVGKTSLIVALGKYSGHTVVRINLSEQTDMMDLLGSDLPVESDDRMQFAWSDGILLQAIKDGSWVLLDELNLAPQSVLEGLNGILDHRAEVFIPELGRSFKCPMSFRVFACQNPSSQGGGRKGLPKSFLNRFTKVYVDELVEDDYLCICRSLYPSISETTLSKLVLFNRRLFEDTMLYHKFGQEGSPWEFNLRDVIRSCEIIQGSPEISKSDCFLNTVYVQRMRTSADRKEVIKLYEQVFGSKPSINLHPRIQLNPQHLIVGNVSIKRNSSISFGRSVAELKILAGLRHNLEAVASCVKHQWLCILVGPASSGKTSLIRLLAQLTGNMLNELNLSSATDISELLGSFEQYNAFRNYRLAIAKVERYINEYCSLKLESSIEEFIRRKDLISLWFSFLSSINFSSPTMTSSTTVETSKARYFDFIPKLVEIIELLSLDLDKNMLPVSWSRKDLDAILKVLKKLEEDHQKRLYSRKFEWVSGLLIKAIENGEWIVLENANFCNPTVLDRINSLVEQSGSITVNECGLVNGAPVVLHPHPRFRLFLTVNPVYGEVSRAMRNRAVEIYMMEPYWQNENFAQRLDENELEDVMRFIILSGIPIGRLVNNMAKAHIYAKREGSRLDVSITHLELARWVQLFQQLVTNGNRLIWSLQISWEHTYLSSLGDGEGKEIVSQATFSYLSMREVSTVDSCQDCLLCLPGGWPNPLILRDFICYSRETSARQNCLYLEFLAMLNVSCSLKTDISRYLTGQALTATVSTGIHLMDSRILFALTFPGDKNYLHASFDGQKGFDSALAQKRLIFAANWTIEQAMESDLKLYLLCFKNFSSQLGRYCSFFHQFLDIMEKEVKHPIWKQILHCRRELISYSAVDLDLTPVPILSMNLIDLAASPNESNSCSRLLINLIKSEGLMRRSFHQWALEKEYDYDKKSQCFKPVLKSLRRIEKKVLELFVGSSSFGVLFQLYSDLLEHHTLLWKAITSSWSECFIVSLRALVKDSVKFHAFCPAEVDNFQNEIKNFNGISCWSFHSTKSLLWAYGGHPFLPPSADLYHKHSQLLNFCELVWPRNIKLGELEETDIPIKGVLSFNLELRFLAMEGVCISSCVMENCNNFDVVQRLEGMDQMLLKRFDFEEHRLIENVRAPRQDEFVPDFSACCSFSDDMLCRRSVYDRFLETVPLMDSTSLLLDAELLEKLSETTLLDVEEQCRNLSGLSVLLKSAMRFSLNHSSRPPTDFSPHQKILWTHGAWEAIQASSEKVAQISVDISSFTLEMWLRWHKSLWVPCHASSEKAAASDILLPDWLFQPVKMAVVDQILNCTIAVRDYPIHSLKYRVALRNLWQACPRITNVYGLLLSAARNIFQNIIRAHQKSFSDEKYAEIKSVFPFTPGRMSTQDDVKHVVSLLASSNHHAFTLLLDAYIEPLLGKLYLERSRDDSIHSIGCAWLWIGCLHYHLLVCCDDVDPAVKHLIKYSHVMEMIASLELENEVREACVRLSGYLCLTETGRYRQKLFEDLHAEAKRLQKKVVFRDDPGKFRKLKHECDEFLKKVTSFASWSKDLESMRVLYSSGVVRNWQETVAHFIEHLSVEYPSYADVVEPVQLALYEVKLGLSLIHSSALSKELLQKVGQPDVESVLAKVYSLMRFPRGCPSKAVSLKASSRSAKLSSTDVEMPTNIEIGDLKLLETLVTFRKDVYTGGTASALQLKANVLLKVVHYITEARFMDNTSFVLLDKIFDEFGNRWMGMKLQLKTKEDSESQQFKFRPHAFKLENIIEIDISGLKNIITNEGLLEWQELLLGEGFSEKMTNKEADEDLEEDWSFLEESLLKDMVDIHNQLFGTLDLDLSLGRLHISDTDIISTFIDSYTLGVRIIRDLEGIVTSGFDASIVPEHLFRICLEHEQKFSSSNKPTHAYNFYKDSNAPFMAKIVKPLQNLKQRILFFLNEWDGHHSLQRILDVIDMVLSMPLGTPLAKALSGLEFLLNRVQMLQETVAKFPLSDQLEPIFALVSSWHKLEFESWSALLDEVQAQFDTNAGKLWFPLYSVLHRRDSEDTSEYNQSTIRSIEEFIKMSSIGEFKKRLQLLLAFHGHISNSLSRGCKSFPFQEENERILYNIFGFYVQFLPMISGHLAASRSSIEMELKELVKLCRWERIDNYLAVENLRRTRPKLKKIIQKYTDLLNQPVILFLNQGAEQGIHIQTMRVANTQVDSFERNKNFLDVVCQQITSQESDRSLWFANWEKKVEFVQQSFQLDDAIQNYTGVTTKIKDSVPPISSCVLERRNLKWNTIGRLCRTVIDCGELWKDEKKKIGKRRAFTDLLKLLESCGLTKHRSANMENDLKSDHSSFWLLQPSYNVHHLLQAPDMDASKRTAITALSDLQNSSHESLGMEWIAANQYYFKSIASVHTLHKISLNFNKDFTLEQVEKSVSYLDHLIEIQQGQRAAAYDLAKQLQCLKEYVWPIANLFSRSSMITSECCYTQNQLITFRCMWQQKQVFDSLCTMVYDESLLLQRFEDNHFTTCPNVKDAAKNIRLFIEKFVPDFRRSKDLLDNHLLGRNKVVFTVGAVLHPYGVTKQMERLVNENFLLLRDFEDRIHNFQEALHRAAVESILFGNYDDIFNEAVASILFGHYDDIFKKVNSIAAEFNSATRASNITDTMLERHPSCHGENAIELEAGFNEALKGTYNLIVNAFCTIGSQEHANIFSEEALRNITLWRNIFVSLVSQLKLSPICDELEKAILSAGKLVNYFNDKISVEPHLRQLYLLLDVILAFGDGLLHDFLVAHRMVSIMTHVLADTFGSLFDKGFGITDDQVSEDGHEKTQEASGTGMGEGAGLKDVSDQIEDEDQLLGTSEKLNEEENTLTDTPSKNAKGIEMEQDFAADTFSVSEESGDVDLDDNEDPQLESAMGETGADSEIVDEKLWDKEEDEIANGSHEKYESGPSITGRDVNGRELRAKEDSATGGDEAEQCNPDMQNEDEGTEEGADNMDEKNIDKENAFADPTELKPDAPNQGAEEDIDKGEPEDTEPAGDGGLDGPEPMEHGETEGTEPMEDGLPEKLDDVADNEGGERESDPMDENTDGVAENSEMVSLENEQGNNLKDLGNQKKDAIQMGTSNFSADDAQKAHQSGTQPEGDSDAARFQEVAPEAMHSEFDDPQNDLAPVSGLPNASAIETTVADLCRGKQRNNNQPGNPLPPSDSFLQKMQPNPRRNVGDALEGWKDRIKVSFDLQDTNMQDSDDLVDENADEYGYTTEFEKGTAQALGPATTDQMDSNVKGNDLDRDTGNTSTEDQLAEMDLQPQPSETHPVKRSIVNRGNNIEELLEKSDLEREREGSSEIHSKQYSDLTCLPESLTSVKRLSLDDDIQFNKLSVSDDDLGKANSSGVSADMRDNAAALWRRYELTTTRLSQELAEQLRLVMEPTLANKLQGDYKTGKRINMKKVIPYIASHYRKDKIWLRRTRPNKRDYQVVIAVDDSRSMLESHCGDVAIEALVTVCRAMSQLEVGNLAVASFGKKGNIRLLHDFDQPFTGEAGIKMISSLTFKQENTIADEPMVDLLKYLNNMLDAAVVNARLPSGHNPLQQLVLIIADGRFHEKENLRRCVRDILGKKRMVAFLLLDSPQESIMDVQEATFEGGKFKLSKYMDSFPFPYYLVLRNIESLPKTLADLLRQWFELMQYSTD